MCSRALSWRVLSIARSVVAGRDARLRIETNVGQEAARERAERSSGGLEKKKRPSLQPSLTCHEAMVNIKSDIIGPVSSGQSCEAVCQWSPSVTVKDVRCKQLLNGAIIGALRHCLRRPMFTKVNREVVYSIYCILDNQGLVWGGERGFRLREAGARKHRDNTPVAGRGGPSRDEGSSSQT